MNLRRFSGMPPERAQVGARLVSDFALPMELLDDGDMPSTELAAHEVAHLLAEHFGHLFGLL